MQSQNTHTYLPTLLTSQSYSHWHFSNILQHTHPNLHLFQLSHLLYCLLHILHHLTLLTHYTPFFLQQLQQSQPLNPSLHLAVLQNTQTDCIIKKIFNFPNTYLLHSSSKTALISGSLSSSSPSKYSNTCIIKKKKYYTYIVNFAVHSPRSSSSLSASSCDTGNVLGPPWVVLRWVFWPSLAPAKRPEHKPSRSLISWVELTCSSSSHNSLIGVCASPWPASKDTTH